jgi:hypothetical protein
MDFTLIRFLDRLAYKNPKVRQPKRARAKETDEDYEQSVKEE